MRRVSIANDGSEGTLPVGIFGFAAIGVIDNSGRYVVFHSDLNNLVKGNIDTTVAVFLHDRDTDGDGNYDEDGAFSTTLIANDSSFPAITPDGRYVTFTSWSSHLIENGTPGKSQVFVYDRTKGTFSLVSVTSEGEKGNNISAFPVISADGRIIVFSSGATNFDDGVKTEGVDLYAHDRLMHTTTRVNAETAEASNDYSSMLGGISADGQYIAFLSQSDLLFEGDTNPWADIFIAELQTPPSPFLLQAPVDGHVIRDTNAPLIMQWTSSTGATSYAIQGVHLSSNTRLGLAFEQTVQANMCSSGVCTASLDVTALEDGTYSWTVVANGEIEAENAPFLFTVNTGAIEVINNGGFETQGASAANAEGWTRINFGGDKRKCGGVGDTSDCAFMVKGGKNEQSVLRQNIDPTRLAQLAIQADDTLLLSARVKSNNVKAGAQVRVRLTYISGKVESFKFPLPATTGGAYADLATTPMKPDEAVKKIRVEVRYINPAATGKFWIDDVQLTLQPKSGGESGDVLPLPLSPAADLRGN